MGSVVLAGTGVPETCMELAIFQEARPAKGAGAAIPALLPRRRAAPPLLRCPLGTVQLQRFSEVLVRPE